MKRKNFVFCAIMLFSLTFAIVSCKKDSTSDSSSNNQKTVEQNKEDINTAGVNFVKELDQMNSSKAFDGLASLSQCMQNGGFGKKKSSKTDAMGIIYPQLQSIILFHQHKMSMTDLYKNMNLLDKKAKDGPNSIQAAYDSIKGVYDWDNVNQQFNKTSESTQLVINFPGSKTSTTNNATLTVRSLDTQIIDGSDIPTGLVWDLKIDGTTYMSYSFEATFSNNIPTSVISTLTIDVWTFNITATLSSSHGSFSYSFKHGTNVIVEFDASANGDWSDSNTSSNPTPDQVIYDGSVTFILMGIKLDGSLDFKDLYPYTKMDVTTLEEGQTIATAINKYLVIQVKHSSDNSLIASNDAYVTSETRSKWVYNYNTNQWEEQTYTAYNIDMRFKFPDGSTADMQTYTKQGFKDFVDELNTFFQNMSDKFGFDYKPMEYTK